MAIYYDVMRLSSKLLKLLGLQKTASRCIRGKKDVDLGFLVTTGEGGTWRSALFVMICGKI